MQNPYLKYLGPEDKLHRAVLDYIKLAYPKALVTHPANEGRRTKFEQFKLKYLGVTSGIPDILCFTPKGNFNGLAIELKTGYNKPTENQKKWLEALKNNGWYAIWTNNLTDTQTEIDNYFAL